MEWICRYFLHRESKWKSWADGFRAGSGHWSYALRQSAMWGKMFEEAKMKFVDLDTSFTMIE